MKLKFCGAAQAVTGSAHLLTLDDGFTILLDCGLYQGKAKDMKGFNEEWLFEPSQIDCVILSHAHIDHTGRLPKLIRDGYAGPVYSTHATRSLCSIMLLDSARIQERDTEWMNKRLLKKKKIDRDELLDPLYTTDDVHETMTRFVGAGYNQWVRIHDDVEVLFRDAGHILGSSSVTLRIQTHERTIHFGFSGDVGRPNRPILRDPQKMPALDYLICESTYGNRLHEAKPDEEEKFLRIIQETCVDRRGKLIIPAFSVGRTQEIVYMLDRMETMGKLPHIPGYVDSPLAVNATMIFGSHPECYDSDLNEYLLIDNNPFGFNNLTYVRDVEISKSLNQLEDACIIISSSGMMNAGRVRHHLFNNIDSEKNTLLIVGYCAPGTPGGILRNGVETIKLFGEWKEVKARIEIMDSFSAHADRNELIEFIQPQKQHVKKIFLVHGELESQEVFAQALNDEGFEFVEIPELGQEYSLR